jgi:hypothetical protein
MSVLLIKQALILFGIEGLDRSLGIAPNFSEGRVDRPSRSSPAAELPDAVQSKR